MDFLISLNSSCFHSFEYPFKLDSYLATVAFKMIYLHNLVSPCWMYTCLQEEVLKVPSNGPAHLSEFECPPSPPSSYDNKFFTDKDFYYRTKEGKVLELQPPQLPPQLEGSFLDKPSSSADIHHSLSRPGFSQLNHLYTQRKDGDQYVAFTSTQRFGNKYVTAILFKPLPETK